MLKTHLKEVEEQYLETAQIMKEQATYFKSATDKAKRISIIASLEDLDKKLDGYMNQICVIRQTIALESIAESLNQMKGA